MKKVTQTIYIVLFLIIIGVGTIMNLPGLWTVTTEVVDNNPYEAWAIKIGLDFNDVFWGKYGFINLNGYLRKLTGQREMNGVVKLDCGKLAAVTEKADVTQQAQNTLELYDWLQQEEIAFAYLQAPYEICKYDPQLPAGVVDYSNENADTFLELISQADVPVLDLREEMHAAGISHYDAIFQTDHHWKIETAFWAFGRIGEYLEERLEVQIPEKYTDIDSYYVETLSQCMLGSNGRSSSLTFGGLDDLTLIYPKFETEVSYAVPEERIYRQGSFQEAYMDNSWLEGEELYEMLQYNVYIGEDQGYTQQKCENAPCDKKILVIKDSYFRPVQAFLGTVFTEVDTIDMRVFEGDVRACIREADPDMVLICYNPFMLQTVGHFSFCE